MALRDNVARGAILVFLRSVYPQGMDAQSICGIFFERINTSQVIDCLAYMADKGYLERRDIPHPYKKLEKIATYRATASGIDLCDGTTSDPGVTLLPDLEA